MARKTDMTGSAEGLSLEGFASALVHSFPELLFVFDRDGRMLRWNRHVESVTGFDAAAITRMSPVDFFPADERPRIEKAIEQAFSHGTARVEAALITRDGSRQPYLFAGSGIRLGDVPVVFGFAIDVSQRREAEQALHESQRFLETLVDNLPGTVYRCRNDRDWTMEFISDACVELLGYTPDEMLAPGPPTLGQLIHPEDQDFVWDGVQQALGAGEPFRITYRLGHREGSYRWVWEQGRGIHAEDGTLLGLEGFISDITEQKQASDELQRLAERLHNTLESITDAFYTLDPDWRFSYVNHEAERALGQSRDSLLGTVIWQALPDLHGSRFETECRRAARERVSVQLEHFREPVERWHEYHIYPSEEGLAVYFRDITREKNDREQIEFLALYDPVTQLPNRRLLEDRMEHALASARRDHRYGALLFIDLDNFKSVNDALGHDQGDILLQQIAKRLSECLRESDTIARFGGDEFAVLLEEIACTADEAHERSLTIAHKLQRALGTPYRLTGQALHPTASIGIIEFSDAGESPQELLKRADLAMYQAKADGRNTIRRFETSMETAAASRIQIETDLREALERSEIDLHYQPQFDPHERIIGAEALARWHHPERGAISPAEFIPVAEQTGLIIPLGHRILDAACRQLAIWLDRMPAADFSLAINVSARQFHEGNFVTDVLDVIDRHGIASEHMVLELTETMLLEDMETSMTTMSVLKQHGLRFSLDDFGTGYSSLAYLKNLPLDQLKIDQTFVRNMATDANDAAIVRAIIGIAESLGLEVVAEGVETDAARGLLAEYGCSRYQGYLFSAPLTATDLTQRLRDTYQPEDWSPHPT
ncbi:MAG: EAL and GGDEF domain-containing protein [Halofilum sp. (in: g-proteobacteria)]